MEINLKGGKIGVPRDLIGGFWAQRQNDRHNFHLSRNEQERLRKIDNCGNRRGANDPFRFLQKIRLKNEVQQNQTRTEIKETH